MCTEKWDSASKVNSLLCFHLRGFNNSQVHGIPSTTPVLLLSGGLDDLVPQEHMFQLRTLFEKMGDLVYPDPLSEKHGESDDSGDEKVDTNPFGIRHRHRHPVPAKPNTDVEEEKPDVEIWQEQHPQDQDDTSSSTDTLSFAKPTLDSEDDDTFPKRSRHSHSFDLRSRARASPTTPTTGEKPSLPGKKITQGKKRLTWFELPFGGHSTFPSPSFSSYGD